jgi:GDP-L-fucose synthase
MIRLSEITAAVTGGAGFLGTCIVEELQQRGCRNVFVVCRSKFDLTSSAAIERLFQTVPPDLLVHAAGVVGGIGANLARPGDFFYLKAIMGIQLLEAARRYPVPKTVILDTICSYPAHTSAPFSEDAVWDGYPEESNAPYGIAKRALLVQCQAYRRQDGMNSIFLMPVNLYGPRDNFHPESSHVIPALIRKCSEARERRTGHVEIWGDGDATREFLYAKDAAEGIVNEAILYDKPRPVNLGSGREISIHDLPVKIAALTGFTGEMRWDKSKPNGQQRRCLDVSRRREFGFEAKTPCDEGLRDTVQWHLTERTASAKSRAAGES